MMKTFLFSICLVVCIGIKAQTAEHVVNEFFTALNAKDTETLNLLTLEDLQLHSLMLSEDIKHSSTSKAKFIEGVNSIPANVNIEERIFDVQSLISGHLAQFQVPYEFYVNGEFTHKGTNVLTLLHTKDGWRVSYIADTREK